MIRDRLEEFFSQQARQGEFSGVVSVQRDGAAVFEGAYGYAHRGFGVRNGMETRFRLASVSKLFTAVAALQLVEQGKLGLETRVVEALGLEGTRIPAEATVEHLLTMTSGMADWFEESGNWEEDWAALVRAHPIYLLRRNEDYLPLFAHSEPVFAVGERHQYNGAGFILLGMLIERLNGLPYCEAVRRGVFERAGMARSGFPALDGVEADVAEGYIPMRDEQERITGWKKNIYSTTPEAAADGGATSTAADLLRFNRALRGGELLGAEMTRAMLTPKVREREERLRGYTWMYGYGSMFLLDDEGRVARWGHTGEEDGVSCRLYGYPALHVDVVILGNQSWCAGEAAWKVHAAVMEAFGG